MLCAALYVGNCSWNVCDILEVVVGRLRLLEVLEVMDCVLLYML